MTNNLITKVLAKEIRDSRGNPTLEVTVWAGDVLGSFSVPSGASTGVHEAHELRDEDGKGVKDAVFKVNNLIAGHLVGKDVLNQKEIDRIMIELDGTPNKDNLGGNSMIGVSVACAKVAAKVSGMEVFEYLRTLAEIKSSQKVPYLYMNLINGGAHAKNDLDFQEYHVVPNIEDAKESVEIGKKIHQTLGEIIRKDLGEDSVVLGDEGGWAPQTNDIKKPLEYLVQVIRENNFEDKVRIALDVAASSFYENGKYKIGGKDFSSEEFLDLYKSLIKEFGIFSIEDPFDEEDFDDFRKLKEEHEGLIVMGDDLTVSNKKLLQKAIDDKSINAILIKPNQIGTLSETLETMQLARENDIKLIISHRSGETDDDFIADLVYAFGCFGLKSGAPTKPERLVKYDRLIKISEK